MDWRREVAFRAMRPCALSARSTYNFMKPSRDLQHRMRRMASAFVCGQAETLTGRPAKASIRPYSGGWWNPVCCRTTTVQRVRN